MEVTRLSTATLRAVTTRRRRTPRLRSTPTRRTRSPPTCSREALRPLTRQRRSPRKAPRLRPGWVGCSNGAIPQRRTPRTAVTPTRPTVPSSPGTTTPTTPRRPTTTTRRRKSRPQRRWRRTVKASPLSTARPPATSPCPAISRRRLPHIWPTTRRTATMCLSSSSAMVSSPRTTCPPPSCPPSSRPPVSPSTSTALSTRPFPSSPPTPPAPPTPLPTLRPATSSPLTCTTTSSCRTR